MFLALGLLFAAHLFAQTTSWPLTVQTVHQEQRDGLRVGDQIEAVNNHSVQLGDGLEFALRAEDDQSVVVFDVLRNGGATTVRSTGYFAPTVGGIIGGSVAAQSDVEIGDHILALDGAPVRSWQDIHQLLSTEGQDVQKSTVLRVHRGGNTTDVPLLLTTASQGRYTLGVTGTTPFALQTQAKPLSDALSDSTDQLVEFFSGAIVGLTKTLFGWGDLCKLTGPVGIAQLSGQALSLGPFAFLQFAGVISASLALMNLLPIPGLDGGHLAGYAAEKLTGKEPSKMTKKVTFIVGVTLIVYLILMATVSDLIC